MVGVDLLMIFGPSKEADRCLRRRRNAVESGEIPREQIDASGERKEHQGPVPLYGGNR